MRGKSFTFTDEFFLLPINWLVAVTVEVVSYYFIKWLDGDK